MEKLSKLLIGTGRFFMRLLSLTADLMQLTKLYVFAHQFRITNLYKLKLLCLKCIHHELPSESYIFVTTFDRSTFFRSVRLTVHDGFQLIIKFYLVTWF